SDELLNKYELEESLLLLYLKLNLEDKVKMLTVLLNSDFVLSYYNFTFCMEKLSFKEGKNILSSIEKELDERWYLSNLLTC
ncbi:hypothetical protein ACQ10P_15935, partial [Enterococcus faecalis]|uniref:hypothetical protein n=1 Tax=Enterococcus faecalis TaxID=1351 RepID=UPI003D6B3F63